MKMCSCYESAGLSEKDNRIHKIAISLLRFVLCDEKAILPNSVNYEELFQFSKSHGVENMIYVGLRDLKADVPQEIMGKFKRAYEMQIMVEATQALELEAIGEAFEEAGIDYVPLKGSVIKYLYPMPDYRKSGDIDILIKPKDKKAVHEIMKENGYAIDVEDEFELHEGYRKPPFILVEIHDRLVEKDNRSYGFLSEIWDFVTLKENTKHLYVMSYEGLYTFTIAHLCKHIRNGGAGIKFIADIYVLQNSQMQKDEKRLCNMLAKARLTEFDSLANEVVKKWFRHADIVSREAAVLEKYIINSGSFGSAYQKKLIRDSSAFEEDTGVTGYKIKQVLTSIFPNRRDMKKQYPFVRKCILLLPVAWILRAVRLVTKDKYKIADKMSVDEKSKELSGLWETVK